MGRRPRADEQFQMALRHLLACCGFDRYAFSTRTRGCMCGSDISRHHVHPEPLPAATASTQPPRSLIVLHDVLCILCARATRGLLQTSPVGSFRHARSMWHIVACSLTKR